jgi:hypothetical protein
MYTKEGVGAEAVKMTSGNTFAATADSVKKCVLD